ncbi:MAG: porin [Rhodospirillales bacterium]|nr:porin [Rhodospirillales bacterium]
MMKKNLIASTALVAVGIAALSSGTAFADPVHGPAAAPAAKGAKVSIAIGGFFKSLVGFAEQDNNFESTANATDRTGYDSFNNVNDSEIYFTGATKLENGIAVSVNMQLETDQSSSGTTIDESYLELTGAFGELRLGSTKAAGHLLKNHAPNVGALDHDEADTNNWIIRPEDATAIDDDTITDVGDADDMKIVYITPPISGFRVGLSYVPSTANVNTQPAVGGTAGTDTQIYDLIVSYGGKIGGSMVNADVGYFQKHGTAANSIKAWRGGMVFTVGGVAIGGSYKKVDPVDSGLAGTATSPEEEVWDIGASYGTGPYKFSAAYLSDEKPLASSTPGEDKVSKFVLGTEYKVGPGIELLGTAAYVKWEDEATDDASNNDGWALVGGIKVSF